MVKKKQINNTPQWVKDLSRIDASLPGTTPFSFIKDQKFATDDNLEVVDIEPGSEIIPEGERVQALSIIVDGIVGIGDQRKGKNKYFWIERTTAERGSILGELEVEMTISKHLFKAKSTSQSAWPSSNLLKWLAAYTDDERTRWGEKVKVLKIHSDVLNVFMDVPQLKEYVLFDQFRKARAYFLEIEEKSNEPIEIAIAKNFSSLYEQRKNVGCVVDDTVYIFGAERYNALSPTSYWLTPEHTGKKAIDGTRLSPKGVNVFKDAQKEAKENLGISLEIKPIYPYKNQESLKTLPEDVKNVFSFKAKNQKVATNEANSRIWIDQGYIVLSLKRINPRS